MLRDIYTVVSLQFYTLYRRLSRVVYGTVRLYNDLASTSRKCVPRREVAARHVRRARDADRHRDSDERERHASGSHSLCMQRGVHVSRDTVVTNLEN